MGHQQGHFLECLASEKVAIWRRGGVPRSGPSTGPFSRVNSVRKSGDLATGRGGGGGALEFWRSSVKTRSAPSLRSQKLAPISIKGFGICQSVVGNRLLNRLAKEIPPPFRSALIWSKIGADSDQEVEDLSISSRQSSIQSSDQGARPKQPLVVNEDLIRKVRIDLPSAVVLSIIKRYLRESVYI